MELDRKFFKVRVIKFLILKISYGLILFKLLSIFLKNSIIISTLLPEGMENFFPNCKRNWIFLGMIVSDKLINQLSLTVYEDLSKR